MLSQSDDDPGRFEKSARCAKRNSLIWRRGVMARHLRFRSPCGSARGAEPRFRERSNKMKTLHVRNLLLLAAFAAAQTAFAAGPAGQAGAAAGAKGGAAVTLPGAAGGANAGGAASVGAGASIANKSEDVPSPNTKALENANGQFTEDRRFGQDRAAERRSEEGAANENATEALDSKASANAKLPRKPSN
jgi:hypothetical protein